ncbi:MAG TPA: hypothetical protein PKH31_06545 [Candidatus Sumerlaeota bacterium]|nr:hypothetical protein [Candidatus Sumerlaeota bacterium]
MPLQKRKRITLGLFSLLLATALWLPCLHLFFRQDLDDYFPAQGLGARTRQVAQRHLDAWTRPELLEREISKMRGTNAEWDFMGCSFLVWSLANMALRDPESSDRYLEAADRIIAETVRLEEEKGHLYFLMDYAKGRDFQVSPNRSLFVDGEIALMMGMRRVAREKAEYAAPMRERLDALLERMRRSPVLSGESYPMECWMFCNSVALAALKTGDYLDGTDHSDFFREWVDTARQKLTHPATGLLVSSYTPDGGFLDGPEGSSIWTVAHFLDFIAPEFARDQYDRARQALGVTVAGFGYAREWPRQWAGKPDVDSGPIVPLLGASAGSSGQAFLAAATFGDRPYLSALLTSLHFAAFPVEREGSLRFCASNQVGDAVLLYAATAGPVLEKIRKGRPQ